MPQYHNVKSVAEAELAGCLEILKDLNNFELVRENLILRIACYLKRADANSIRDQINEEYQTVTIPEYEYVINELQYELRVAKTLGYKELDVVYEADILKKWAMLIIDRFGVDAALDFINVLKTNREKRVRTFEIIR